MSKCNTNYLKDIHINRLKQKKGIDISGCVGQMDAFDSMVEDWETYVES